MEELRYVHVCCTMSRHVDARDTHIHIIRMLIVDIMSHLCGRRYDQELERSECQRIGELGDVQSHLNQIPESDKLLEGRRNLVQNDLLQKIFKEELNRQREEIQELKQQHTDLQKLRLYEEEFMTFREELRQASERCTLNQYWMTLLLLSILVLTGGVVYAYLYQTDLPTDTNKNELNICMEERDRKAIAKLSSKIENLSFNQQLLKENFMKCCMNTSNLTDLYSKVKELENGISQIISNVQQMELVTKQDNESLENFKKQIMAIKDELRHESSLNVNANEFLEMKSEIQYLGQQVDFPVLPVYLNMTDVREYNASKGHWLSEPFYTHRRGYRMRLVVYPNGKDSGADTHVSVVIHLMSGKYDHKLDWPVNVMIRVTLLDQDSKDKDPISRIFDWSSSLGSNDQLWNSTMAKTGMIYPRFAAHQSLSVQQKNACVHSYIKYDSLYFRVDKAGHEAKFKQNKCDYKRSHEPSVDQSDHKKTHDNVPNDDQNKPKPQKEAHKPNGDHGEYSKSHKIENFCKVLGAIFALFCLPLYFGKMLKFC